MEKTQTNPLTTANRNMETKADGNEGFDPIALLETMSTFAKKHPELRYRVIPHIYYEAVVEAKENLD